MKDYFSDISFSNSKNEVEKGQNNKTSKPTNLPLPTTPEAAMFNYVIDIANQSIQCFTDYLKCKEHEKTERQRIYATLSAIECKINAEKEICLKQLNADFANKNRMYDMAEQAQKKALESNDIEMLKLVYNFILHFYNENEFNPSINFKGISSIPKF